MKRRILVVEDDPLSRELLSDWLETEGYEVLLADTLEAGFASMVAEPPPSAVLLDVHLGTQNGLALAHWIRRQRHRAHLPLVAVTASVSAKEKRTVQDAGCDACLSKPLDFRALRSLLDKLLPPPGD